MQFARTQSLISGSGARPDQLHHLGIGRRHPAFPIQRCQNESRCVGQIALLGSQLGLGGIGLDQMLELIPEPIEL